jgi:hypothetical protein
MLIMPRSSNLFVISQPQCSGLYSNTAETIRAAQPEVADEPGLGAFHHGLREVIVRATRLGWLFNFAKFVDEKL